MKIWLIFKQIFPSSALKIDVQRSVMELRSLY